MNSLDKLKKAGKINRNVVSSLYKNGPRIRTDEVHRSFKNGRPVAKEVHVEPHQAIEHAAPHDEMFYTAQNYSSSIFGSANGKIDIKIDKASCEKAHGLKFRIRLTESGGSNPVTPVPVPYFFDRIEFWADNGSGQEISRIYADNMYWNYNVYSEEQGSILLKNINSSSKWENGKAIAAGKYEDYYLEMPGSWFEIVKPHIKSLKGDILCKLYTRNGIIASGSGTIALSQLDLILEHEDLDSSDSQLHTAEHEDKIFRHTYLDIVQVSESKTCTASTETKWSLENLNGKCAFLLFCLRSGSSPAATSNGLTNYSDLTDLCQVDLLGPQNQKLLGHGTPLYAKELKSLMTKHFPGALGYYKNVYIIPFCSSAMQAFTGTKDGYFYFNGENYNLSLTFPGAGTQEVQTITLTNPANDGGYYQLSYKGYLTNSLAYNTSAANMKAALDALPSMIEDGLTSTFSGTAEATFTITFSPAKQVAYQNGHSANLVRIIPTSLNDGGVAEIGATTVTTVGSPGWTTGTYTLDLYAYHFKDIYINDGRIKLTD